LNSLNIREEEFMCQGKEDTRYRCLLKSCGEELKKKDFSNHEIKLTPSQAGKTGFSTLLVDRPNRYHLNEIRFVFLS
jgi:hypothetical protein